MRLWGEPPEALKMREKTFKEVQDKNERNSVQTGAQIPGAPDPHGHGEKSAGPKFER